MKKALVLFAFSVLFTSGAFSQTAQLTGTITDQTGSVVPGTKVVATNIDTGVARATVANDQGNYLVTALLPGSYRVTTEAAGFKQISRGPITLAIDQIGRLDFSLEVGEARETVSVEASAVLLDSATSTVGATVENRQITELPLNGRSPMDLIALTAGIRVQGTFGGRLVMSGTPGGAWMGFSLTGAMA